MKASHFFALTTLFLGMVAQAEGLVLYDLGQISQHLGAAKPSAQVTQNTLFKSVTLKSPVLVINNDDRPPVSFTFEKGFWSTNTDAVFDLVCQQFNYPKAITGPKKGDFSCTLWSGLIPQLVLNSSGEVEKFVNQNEHESGDCLVTEVTCELGSSGN